MIFQLQAKDTVLRLGSYDALNGVQNLNIDTSMNTEHELQLGDANFVAQTSLPSTTGSFEAKATGSLSAFLSRMIYTVTPATGEFAGYLAGASQTGLNTQLIRETDLQFAVFDLIESKKADEVFDRSTLIPRAHLTSISISAKADGTASESYAFEGDILEIYRKPFHDLVSLAGTRTTASLTTSIDTPDSANTKIEVAAGANLANATHILYGVYIGNLFIAAANFVPTWVTTTYSGKLVLTAAAVTAGLSIPQGEKLAVICYRKTPGTFPVITYPTAARFVKADQVDIWLVDPAATTLSGGQTRTVENHLLNGVSLSAIPFAQSDLLLRVQSVDLSIPIQREALQELRQTQTGTSVYFRAATYPLNISCSLAINETDLNEWAKLQGKNAYGSATPDILNLKDFENKAWVVAVRYYKAGTTVQTVALLNGVVEGAGKQVATGSRSQMHYSLNGSKVAIQGV